MPLSPTATNRIGSRWPNGFFNNAALLGATLRIVNAGASFVSPTLDLSGFCSVTAAFNCAQAAGGTVQLFLDAVDPETDTPLTLPYSPIVLALSAGPTAGDTAIGGYNYVTETQLTTDPIIAVPLWFNRLRWKVSAAQATLSSARLWARIR